MQWRCCLGPRRSAASTSLSTKHQMGDSGIEWERGVRRRVGEAPDIGRVWERWEDGRSSGWGLRSVEKWTTTPRSLEYVRTHCAVADTVDGRWLYIPEGESIPEKLELGWKQLSRDRLPRYCTYRSSPHTVWLPPHPCTHFLFPAYMPCTTQYYTVFITSTVHGAFRQSETFPICAQLSSFSVSRHRMQPSIDHVDCCI